MTFGESARHRRHCHRGRVQRGRVAPSVGGMPSETLCVAAPRVSLRSRLVQSGLAKPAAYAGARASLRSPAALVREGERLSAKACAQTGVSWLVRDSAVQFLVKIAQQLLQAPASTVDTGLDGPELGLRGFGNLFVRELHDVPQDNCLAEDGR